MSVIVQPIGSGVEEQVLQLPPTDILPASAAASGQPRHTCCSCSSTHSPQTATIPSAHHLPTCLEVHQGRCEEGTFLVAAQSPPESRTVAEALLWLGTQQAAVRAWVQLRSRLLEMHGSPFETEALHQLLQGVAELARQYPSLRLSFTAHDLWHVASAVPLLSSPQARASYLEALHAAVSTLTPQ